jgi:PUA domain protein
MRIKERHHARKGTIQAIRTALGEISPAFSALLGEGSTVEVATADGEELILVDGEVALFRVGGKYFPTLRGALRIRPDRRTVTVDQGAVPYLLSGADVMRPGVVAFDPDLKAGEPVIIDEERHRKPLAIGIALWDAEEFRERKTGKCVKTIHHVGDKLWEIESSN